MARSNIVKTLERKFARLLGHQLKARRAVPSIAADMVHVEAVLRMFEPDWDKSAVKPIAPRTPLRWQKRGAGVRTAIRVLQQADRALTATEIAHATCVATGGVMPKPREIAIIGTDLIWSLRRYFVGRLIVTGERPRRYRLMPPAANIRQTPARDAIP